MPKTPACPEGTERAGNTRRRHQHLGVPAHSSPGAGRLRVPGEGLTADRTACAVHSRCRHGHGTVTRPGTRGRRWTRPATERVLVASNVPGMKPRTRVPRRMVPLGRPVSSPASRATPAWRRSARRPARPRIRSPASFTYRSRPSWSSIAMPSGDRSITCAMTSRITSPDRAERRGIRWALPPGRCSMLVSVLAASTTYTG